MRRARGQAILPVMFVALVLALGLFTTLSVWQAARARIQLQATADTAAYSVALVEARTFNFLALTNRAMAAHHVAALLVYAELSYLTAYDNAVLQAYNAWFDYHLARAGACGWPGESTGSGGGGYVIGPKLGGAGGRSMAAPPAGLPAAAGAVPPDYCCSTAEHGHIHDLGVTFREFHKGGPPWDPQAKFPPGYFPENGIHPHLFKGEQKRDQIVDFASKGHDEAAGSLFAAQGVAWESMLERIKWQSIPRAIADSVEDELLAAPGHPTLDPSGATRDRTLSEVRDTVFINGSGGADDTQAELGRNDMAKIVNASRLSWTRKVRWLDGEQTRKWFNPGELVPASFGYATNVVPAYPAAKAQAQTVGTEGIPGVSDDDPMGDAIWDRIDETDLQGKNGLRYVHSVASETQLELVASGPCGQSVSKSMRSLVKSAPRDQAGSLSNTNQHLEDFGSREGMGGYHNQPQFHFLGHKDPRTDSWNVIMNAARFDANPDPGQLFNQPSAWVLLQARPQDQSWTLRGGIRGYADESAADWDLSPTAGGPGRARVEAGAMAALSRALVYYHRPKATSAVPGGGSLPCEDDPNCGWKEHPNLWNPFWRAKLEAWVTGEPGDLPPAQQGQVARDLLRAAGYDVAAQLPLRPTQ